MAKAHKFDPPHHATTGNTPRAQWTSKGKPIAPATLGGKTAVPARPVTAATATQKALNAKAGC